MEKDAGVGPFWFPNRRLFVISSAFPERRALVDWCLPMAETTRAMEECRDGKPGRRQEREQDAGGEEAVRRCTGWQAIRSERARSRDEESTSLDGRGAQVVFAWRKEVWQRRLEEHLAQFRDHQDSYASGQPRIKVLHQSQV